MRYPVLFSWLTVLIILSLFLIAIITIDNSWLIDPDSAAYVGLSKSILEGDGYSFSGIPHTKYPPLFPLILSLSGWISGPNNYRVMQYCVASFWVLSIVFTYLLFSGYKIKGSSFFSSGVQKNHLTGLVFAVLFASSIYMLQYSVVFLRTEIVFTALSLISIWLGIQIQKDKTPHRKRLLYFVLLFHLTYFTRREDVALIGALAIVMILDKESWVRRQAKWISAILIVLLCSVGPICWMVRNECVATKASTDYSSEFTQKDGLDLTKNRDLAMDKISIIGMVKRIAANAYVFSESCAKMLLNSNKGGAKSAFSYGFGALCIFGFFFCIIRRRSFVDYYCALYLALYLIWPFNQQQRFYMPIFPFLVEYGAITVLLLNRLLPILLRHKGAWYLFFFLQAPILAVAYSARSDHPQIWGRYSTHYLVFLVTITVTALIINIFLIYERSKPGGVKWMLKTIRLGAPLIYLCGFISLGFNDLLIDYPNNRAKFENQNKLHPPLPVLENIETQPELIMLSTWIIENTTEDDVIMCDIPKMIHMLTKRRTIPFTFHSKHRTIAAEVGGLQPTHIYYSGEIEWVYDLFQEACIKYKKVILRCGNNGDERIIEIFVKD